MHRQTLPRLSFTSGELSPWLYGRTDLDAVSRGASLLQNMLVSPFGGLERRQGTQWIADAGSQDGCVRLMTFAFSNGDQFVLELGRGYIRYYRDGDLMRDQTGEAYTTPTPWVDDGMVASLRMQQLNDVIYFVTPHVCPHVLERYGDMDWRLGPLVMKTLPLVSVLGNSIKLQFTRDTTVPRAFLRVETDGDVFTSDMEGNEYVCITTPIDETTVDAYTSNPPIVSSLNRSFYKGEIFCMNTGSNWRTGYCCIKDFYPGNYQGMENPESYPEYFVKGIATHTDIVVVGGWNVQTFGTWDAEWSIEKSYDENPGMGRDGWVRVKTMIQNDDKRNNYSVSGEETLETTLSVKILSWKADGNKGVVEIRIASSEYRHWLKVVKVGSARQAWLGTNRDPYVHLLNSGSTNNWSMAAFGVYSGFPSIVEFHQGRLWFACTRRQPQTVWASAVDDLSRFLPGSGDDSPLTLTLAASQQNRICWMSALKGLAVGTNEGEWNLRGSDGGPVTAANAAFEKQSSIGSADREALTVENTLYFVQQGGGKIMEYSYSLEYDGYVSSDVSLLAEHILGIGVVDWASQRSVSLRVWCVLGDGSIACMTVNRMQNVIAWQRHSLAGGHALSVTTVKTASDWKDEVWFLVRRNDGIRETLSIERMAESGIYLDSCLIARSAGNCLSGLDHLAGKDVTLYRQEHPEEAWTVNVSEDGGIVLPRETEDDSCWVAGLPYVSQWTTMPLETTDVMGRHKMQVKSKLLMKQSGLSFEYSGDVQGAGWQTYNPARYGLAAPYSGYVELTHFTGGHVQPVLSVRTGGTMPLTVLAVVPEVSVVAS